MNDFFIFDITACNGFPQGLSCHGDAVQMQHARPPLDFVQNGGNSTCAMNIFHMPFARWTHFADMRHLICHRIDAVQRIVHAGFVGQCQSVQDRIRRAAHGHIQCERVVDCIRRDNVARFDIAFDQSHDLRGGLSCQSLAFGSLRQCGTVIRQCQAEYFHQAIHRVGGEHARTRAAGRTGKFFQNG